MVLVMHLPRTQGRAPRLDVLPTTASTNTDLVQTADERMHGSVVATLDQTAGRGRLGRVWTAPPRRCLAASVLLRPVMADGAPLPLERFGWFPLLAGACLAETIVEVLDAPDVDVAVKWPNDVQVRGRKISGVLAELVPSSGAVVIGTGVNLTLRSDELPVPTATSLVLEGASGGAADLADRLLAAYLERLLDWSGRFARSGGDADASGARDYVLRYCSTIGLDVRIVRSGLDDLHARAVGLDAAGRLEIRLPDGRMEALAAGDVTHLRPGTVGGQPPAETRALP